MLWYVVVASFVLEVLADGGHDLSDVHTIEPSRRWSMPFLQRLGWGPASAPFPCLTGVLWSVCGCSPSLLMHAHTAAHADAGAAAPLHAHLCKHSTALCLHAITHYSVLPRPHSSFAGRHTRPLLSGTVCGRRRTAHTCTNALRRLCCT